MHNYTNLTIQIKYHNPDLKPITKIDIGNWIDLRSADTVDLKAGEFKVLSLGVSMKLPWGYEAHVVPRSSTFKHFGVIQTNHFGVIDNSYSGTNDIWKFPVIAFRDTTINLNDRVCQFRLNKIQPNVYIEEVTSLDSVDRGGFGSTGIN